MAGYPKLTEQYIPNFQGKIPDDVAIDIRRHWMATYALRDVQFDVVDITMTKDTLVNRDLVAGKPLLVILRQDVTGGWTATFDPKFKGQAALGPLDTTANTYTVIFFYSPSSDYTLFVAGITGGPL